MQDDNDWSELQNIIKNQVLGNITVNAKEKELSDELKKLGFEVIEDWQVINGNIKDILERME